MNNYNLTVNFINKPLRPQAELKQIAHDHAQQQWWWILYVHVLWFDWDENYIGFVNKIKFWLVNYADF